MLQSEKFTWRFLLIVLKAVKIEWAATLDKVLPSGGDSRALWWDIEHHKGRENHLVKKSTLASLDLSPLLLPLLHLGASYLGLSLFPIPFERPHPQNTSVVLFLHFKCSLAACFSRMGTYNLGTRDCKELKIFISPRNIRASVIPQRYTFLMY